MQRDAGRKWIAAGLLLLAGIGDLIADVRLQNDRIAVQVGPGGALREIVRLDGSHSYAVRSDAFEIETDRGTFNSGKVVPVFATTKDGATYKFNSAGQFEVTLEYQLRAEHDYFERRLIIKPAAKITLLKVTFGPTEFATAPDSVVNYETFYNAPAVSFLRWEKGGIFTGVENPFFTAKSEKASFGISFEPSLYLNPGDTYDTEPQFVGLYAKQGVSISDRFPLTAAGWLPRFENPSGHVPLDRGEIRAMQKFAYDYLNPQPRPFQFILYNYFDPLPAFPKPGSPEEKTYLQMIDTFHELGGDRVIFNPLVGYERPGLAPDATWNIAPPGSAVETILKHTAELGIGAGFYMGVARGPSGNAAALPFVPEKSEWKKQDDQGTTADENCLACDDYEAWWSRVQRNTIAKYHLAVWDWDPGPGNGLHCYSDKHGHVPGKGEYKGWRNSMKLLAQFRQEFPDLYLQTYYGRKEYGLWGMKYFDQSESYWEQTIPYFATIHPDLHADRINADGIRLQAWWNNNFRFFPSYLSHAMVHRIQEGNWDPRLTRAWDQLGWKYSVLSGLAVNGASITTVILPEKAEDVPGMKEFYAKWLGWARKNSDLARYTVAFGSQVQVGGIDGWARIKGDHGFVFLCNLNPRPTRIEFGLDDEIGLTAKGSFTLQKLNPDEGQYLTDAGHLKGVFAGGDRVEATVPAYEIMVFELAPATNGFAAPVVATSPQGKTVTRFLDDWRMPDGTPFHFPDYPQRGDVKLTTTFLAADEIRQALEAAKPPNLADYETLIDKWKKIYPDNFAWSRPDRLWLVLPFTDAATVHDITGSLNGQPIAMQNHAIGRRIIYYADLTDSVKWGEKATLDLNIGGLQANQFLGPYLDYPPAAVPWELAKVVFDKPLDPVNTRSVPPSGEGPQILTAEFVPDHFHDGVEVQLDVAVSLPPDQLRAVRCSGWQIDQNLQFDAARQKWSCKFKPADRWNLILDVSKFEIWAVAKNGQVGNRYVLPVKWRFDRPISK